MSGAPNPQYAFENLTQSGLLRANSKDDKNVSLSIDTFGGNTSFVVFTGAGGKPWKVNLPRKTISNVVILLRKMKADIRPCREPIMLNQFDTETKRFKQVGQIGIGIDDNLQFQIDVVHNELNGRHTFPIRPDGKFDFSNTSLSEKEGLEAILDWLINILSVETLIAERLSSFKRAPGGMGGNRGGFGGGGGGNRNYGGGQGGGGYQQRQNTQQSNTFGGGVDSDNDLHV